MDLQVCSRMSYPQLVSWLDDRCALGWSLVEELHFLNLSSLWMTDRCLHVLRLGRGLNNPQLVLFLED